MKQDWENRQANQDGACFPMTETYAPYPAPFAPDGYGFVLIDFQTKTILSSQEYAALASIDISRLFIPRPGEGGNTIWDRAEKLHNAGILTHFRADAQTAQALKNIVPAPTTPAQADGYVELAFPAEITSLRDKITLAGGPEKNMATLCVKPAGWTIVDFPMGRLSNQAINALFAQLDAMNWPVEPGDKAAFEAFYAPEDDDNDN